MLAMSALALEPILAWLNAASASTTQLTQLSADSRKISTGDVFVAYPVDGANGRDYIAHAIAQGAGAVLYEADGFEWNPAWNVPHLAVNELPKHAGQIANAYYGQPDAGMLTVAVTGTNGKTSCTQWLGSMLAHLGEPTAVIGTLGVGLVKRNKVSLFDTTGYTTPDAILLQRTLAEMRDAGAKAVAIEASSIGLVQARMDGMHVDVALFTNFTRDHLDYHGDMAAYEAAKTMLFDWPGLAHAVINLDDEMGQRLVERLQRQAVPVSMTGYTLLNKTSTIPVLRADDIRSTHAGTVFRLDSPSGSATVKTRLVGRFNVSNVLGVAAVLLARGVALHAVVDAIEALTAVPGRMQQLGGQDAPLIVIDYAHTPDALEKTLATLQQVAQERHGKLWWNRDAGKRPQMGTVSQMADHVIVTSDNPRNEHPASIIAQIAAGMDKTQPQMIEDRAAAILWAVKHAAKHDVILLAGKGHETTQEIKGRKLPFLDADHALLALATRATMKGLN
jgi:UDP-N-acetylmuramoyl-L-alanyl-D-glutamate--2,6-diaminopimelate ligase